MLGHNLSLKMEQIQCTIKIGYCQSGNFSEDLKSHNIHSTIDSKMHLHIFAFANCPNQNCIISRSDNFLLHNQSALIKFWITYSWNHEIKITSRVQSLIYIIFQHHIDKSLSNINKTCQLTFYNHFHSTNKSWLNNNH